MTILPLSKEFFGLVRAGRKTSTIRRGLRRWEFGPAILKCGSTQVHVVITNIKHTEFGSLTESDARKDGFASLLELDAVLKHFYPSISNTDPVTIVSFERINDRLD